MKKRTYVMPTMELIKFDVLDVMLSSGNKGYQSDPFEKNPFEGGSV